MKYCVDTWFLIQLTKKNEVAGRIIKETVIGKNYLVIPSVTFAELTRKLLQRGKKIDIVLEFIENLEKNKKVQILQTTKELVIEAGKISFSFNIPTVDAIIASTAKMMNCDEILSEDEHYRDFCKKNKIKLKSW